MLKSIVNSPVKSGDQTIVNGNLVIGTSGKGIDFSASGGNVLSQYDEGSYVTALSPTTSGSVTLLGTNNTLQYTRIGRMVTVVGRLMVDSVNSPVGALAVDLPFAVASGESFHSAVSLMVNGSNGPLAADYVGFAQAGTTQMFIYLGDGNYLQSDSAESMQPNTQINISATYFV